MPELSLGEFGYTFAQNLNALGISFVSFVALYLIVCSDLL
ncbi:hypothetical protein L1278_001033 [Pontibacter sp. HSC-36F09]|nr:hypothetical protein [Pontibacter sp. HSC-36F09]